MKDNVFSTLSRLRGKAEGANFLLEFYEDFSERLFACRDFKSVLNTFAEELRKIYPRQHIEFILTQNQQNPVKFLYSEPHGRVVPGGKFPAKNTLYQYVLDKQQVVLTNSYAQFCRDLAVQTAGLAAHSWIGIPLMVRGKLLGALVLYDDRPDHYLRLLDKQLLNSLTNIAGFAMENIYLYDYLVEENGSYKIFDNLLPKGPTRNSVKSVLSQLQHSVLAQPEVAYSGLFLGMRQGRKWRLLNECYREAAFSTVGSALLAGLSKVPLAWFDESEHHFWQRRGGSSPLTRVFDEPLANHPVESALYFPFVINGQYLGTWIVAFSREREPEQDEIQMYRFIFYVMTQLIEKKAFIEQNRKYETYMKHLERMKVMGELASGTAHNLNNILSVIIGKGQLLYKRLEHTPYIRDLQLLLQAAQDGAHSIRRLQDYSTAGTAAEARENLNVNAIVREVVEIARPRFAEEAQSRGINYELKLALGDVKPVKGNSTTLREVILNLINNALEAMPKGGKLSIQTTLKDDRLLIFVSDTGAGISAEIRDKIFDPFYTTKGKRGNGLGLSIAADIVAQHEGKIYVDSSPGKGAIFMIELPTCGEEILSETPRPEFYQPLSYKVLLVEDEGVVRETLAEMLEDEGCDVKTASNAKEALQTFQKHRCDVVLADLSMPEINGVELARELKTLDPNIPVFIVTGWSQRGTSLARANGMIDGVIHKPFNMERIRQEMVRVISGKVRHFHKNGFSN